VVIRSQRSLALPGISGWVFDEQPVSRSSVFGRLSPFAVWPARSAIGTARCQDSLQCLAGRGGSSEIAE